MVLSMATWFSASAVLPQLRDEWSLSTSSASWLTIAVQLGFVAGALVSAVANLADTVAPRRLILAGSLVAAAANLGLLAVSGAAGAIVLRVVTGIALAAVYPPALKAMSTWFRAGRGTALGIMVGALTLGSALPHLVNGVGGVAWETVIVTTSLLHRRGGPSGRVRVPRRTVRFPACRLRSEAGGQAEPRSRRPAHLDRLLRAHVGALRHVGVVRAAFATDALRLHDVADPTGAARRS